MKYKNLLITGDKVEINNHQTIYVQREKIKQRCAEIKFPVMIVDTEFFNKSHDWENIENKLYNDENKDIIYLINYSFAKNFKEIQIRNNFKAINNLCIKRKANDPKYCFNDQYNALIISFINMCINKRIKTIIFAGQDNDKKIIENWLNKHKSLIHNKTSELFIFNKETKEYTLNCFDIYNILEQNVSFTNFTKDGDKFYNEQNLKNGQVENTIAIRSLKKFFDYTTTLHPKLGFLDEDIAFLCSKALKFFSLPTLDSNQHHKLAKYIKQAKQHCYDDVLKILLLIKFLVFVITKENKGTNE